MNKIIFFLLVFLCFISSFRVSEANNDEIISEIFKENEKYKKEYYKIETEKYKKECYEKEAFPKGIDNYSMYNDDIKDGSFRYHQCIKKIIVQKIKETVSPEVAEKMIKNLSEIEKGVLDYYWTLYNQQNTGTIGRMQNDVILGNHFDSILEDIIYYQSMHKIH